MKQFQTDRIVQDAVHGYIPFVSEQETPAGEIAEETLIDHRWVQRLRQIHQLQTAWLVYPTAEHTRFQHSLGVMHLASQAIAGLYESLQSVCPDVPSRGYVESLMRVAGLLHDVGHGPFGHFFDDHFLAQFGETHESLGGKIICDELGSLISAVRRNPNSALEEGEQLDPQQVAMLIRRPTAADQGSRPRWLELLQSLFCGIYTIDNMDFVMRDAYMSGYNTRAFDLQRLLHYSFFTERGLTIHQRGVEALLRFISVRAELFRTIYFHRAVRAIDLSLGDLFVQSSGFLFPGNPAENLAAYQRFTEWSLLLDVATWETSDDEKKRDVGLVWRKFLDRRLRWQMVCQRHLVFDAGASESSSLFGDADLLEHALRKNLPADLASLPLRVDLARHVYRPETQGANSGLNFLFDPTLGETRPLSDDQLFRQLPQSHRICRIYAESADVAEPVSQAIDQLISPGGRDDLTNL